MSYFNTTNQKADFVELAEDKALNQEQTILHLFNTFKTMTASDCAKMFECVNTPITSIRRGMTNLKNLGILTKTDNTQIGMYGRPEYVYELNL